MSLKSFPGVFEEMDVPKKVWDDVRWLGEPVCLIWVKQHEMKGDTLPALVIMISFFLFLRTLS